VSRDALKKQNHKGNASAARWAECFLYTGHPRPVNGYFFVTVTVRAPATRPFTPRKRYSPAPTPAANFRKSARPRSASKSRSFAKACTRPASLK
jgi:hypothetical protein